MRCEECVHKELCADYVSSLAEVQNADVEFISQWLDEIEGKINQTDNECEHFIDRSRFVELPVKLGEKVFYFDTAGRIYESTASQVIYGSTGFLIDSDVMFNSNLIGKRFFLTREEADQALKEREDHA